MSVSDRNLVQERTIFVNLLPTLCHDDMRSSHVVMADINAFTRRFSSDVRELRNFQTTLPEHEATVDACRMCKDICRAILRAENRSMDISTYCVGLCVVSVSAKKGNAKASGRGSGQHAQYLAFFYPKKIK